MQGLQKIYRHIIDITDTKTLSYIQNIFHSLNLCLRALDTNSFKTKEDMRKEHAQKWRLV